MYAQLTPGARILARRLENFEANLLASGRGIPVGMEPITSLRNVEQPVAARTSTGPDTPRPCQLMAAPCPRGAAALHPHGHALSLQAHVGHCVNLRVSFREKEACSSGSGHLSSSVSRGPRTRGRGQLGWKESDGSLLTEAPLGHGVNKRTMHLGCVGYKPCYLK